MCGKIWDVKYIGPNTWNKYKTNINLDYFKDYINDKYKLSCNKMKVMYLVSKKSTYEAFAINMYHNETKLCSINHYGRIEFFNNKNARLYSNEYLKKTVLRDLLEDLQNKECQNTTVKIKYEIKEYVKNYNKN